MSYFIELHETKTIINLAHVTLVEYAVPEELQGTAYTTTVSLLGGGGVYITRNDATTLWKALQHYNARYTQAVVALPQLVSTLAALVGPVNESEHQDGGLSASINATTSANPVNPANHNAGNGPVGVGAGKVSREQRARAVSSN